MKIQYSCLLVIIALLLITPNTIFSAVNLPWSTTYNCPEWKQTDGNPNCDGLTEYGTWTTNDGKEEQITTAANYAGGGRGQRHWLGDGSANNSGGTRIEFASPQQELWIRWYMRFQTGFTWSDLQNFKILYIDTGLPSCVVPRLYSWDRVNLATCASPQNHPSADSNGWNSVIANNGTLDANGNRQSDGQWHLYEVHLKMDTNGSNGIAEMWIDNVLRLSYTNVDFSTQAGWTFFVIGSNHAYSANGTAAYYVDYDDFVVSGIAASPVVNSGGGSNETSSSGGGCGFMKDDSDKPNSDKGQFAISMVMLLLSLIFIRMRRLWKPKLASLFISGMFLLLPNVSSAAVNLPWSTTYNCPDWTQSNGLGNVNCDGLTGFGDWTCNNGDGTIREEQITAAANYPSGGGGKGQRHWLGDGVNNISGEMRIDWSPNPQNEIWIRWYMRYESGFRWNPLVDNKILNVNPGYVNRTIFGFAWSDQIRIFSNGYNGLYYSAVGDGWRGIMGGDAGDGQWHLYEIHLKMDTNGNDGIAEAWVDGIKRISYTNANFGGSQGAPGWSALQVASNSNAPSNSRCMAVDYDDISISGIPASTAGNSSGSDGSSDASISGGGCGFVKDINGKGQGAEYGIAFLVVDFAYAKKDKNKV